MGNKHSSDVVHTHTHMLIPCRAQSAHCGEHGHRELVNPLCVAESRRNKEGARPQ